MESNSNYRWLIFFVALLHTGFFFGQQTNLKNPDEYPLNDPRNPNCPCHFYQQLANQEYNDHHNPVQQKEISLNNFNFKQITQENNKSNQRHAFFFSKMGRSSDSYVAQKTKRKKTLITRLVRAKHAKGRERKQRAVGNCFHWI